MRGDVVGTTHRDRAFLPQAVNPADGLLLEGQVQQLLASASTQEHTHDTCTDSQERKREREMRPTGTTNSAVEQSATYGVGRHDKRQASVECEGGGGGGMTDTLCACYERRAESLRQENAKGG